MRKAAPAFVHSRMKHTTQLAHVPRAELASPTRCDLPAQFHFVLYAREAAALVRATVLLTLFLREFLALCAGEVPTTLPILRIPVVLQSRGIARAAFRSVVIGGELRRYGEKKSKERKVELNMNLARLDYLLCLDWSSPGRQCFHPVLTKSWKNTRARSHLASSEG